MEAVAAASRPLEGKTAERALRARSFGLADPKPFERREAEERLRRLGLLEAAL
jgi:hypothetical protein